MNKKMRKDVLPEGFADLAKSLGFNQENQALLLQALTHPAYFEGVKTASPQDNQRMEFLGDAVLDLVVGDYLYNAYPNLGEGTLSKMRAVIVCEASLAHHSAEIGFQRCLRLGKGSEASGDRERPSILADAFEAVIGAMFVALGYEAARKFILGCFAEQMQHLTPDDYEDKKSLLQELVQHESLHGVSYKLLTVSGPDHAPRFESGAYCGKLLIGKGMGGSKKESEQAAAVAALAAKNNWLPRLRGGAVKGESSPARQQEKPISAAKAATKAAKRTAHGAKKAEEMPKKNVARASAKPR